MTDILDENVIQMNEKKPILNETGLYKVFFQRRGEQEFIDLLLETGKKKKRSIRQMIASITNIDIREIKRVKLRFRKRIQGFTAGIEGTKAYIQLVELKKQERKRKGQAKRLFSRYHIPKHPFQPTSKTIQWSRHFFLGTCFQY